MSLIDKDLKDKSGEWIMSMTVGGVSMQTRIGRLFNSINQRSKEGGSFQRRWDWYLGTTIAEEFTDPQQFGDWCVQQIGWGVGYDLDKDLLGGGQKLYSPKTCVFLPRRINRGISERRRTVNPSLPSGVFYVSGRTDRFYAKINVEASGPKIIGLFDNVGDANAAYCEAKIDHVKTLAGEYKDTIDTRAYDALMNWKIE